VRSHFSVIKFCCVFQST